MLELKLDKPFRCFANIYQARKHNDLMDQLKKGEWPCPKCNVSGRIIDPNAQCDPAEGYKMADRVTCPACEGTGRWTKKKFHAWYKKNYSDKYQEEMKQWHKKQALLKNIKNKLAQIEIEVLIDAFRDTYGR